MISSLANFLVLVLYRGGFPERVSWTLLMFTLGAVGIARVAIERDKTLCARLRGDPRATGVRGDASFRRFTRFQRVHTGRRSVIWQTRLCATAP